MSKLTWVKCGNLGSQTIAQNIVIDVKICKSSVYDLGLYLKMYNCLGLLVALASCLSYARALLEYVIFLLWVRSVSKMLPSVIFADDKVLTFLILCEKC